MWSYASVYELDYFADVFGFEEVRHYLGHHLFYLLEILVLVLYQSTLEKLDQVFLDYLDIVYRLFTGVKLFCQFVKLDPHLCNFADEEFFEPINASISLFQFKIRKQFQQ